MLFVEGFENRCEDSGVFATRRTNCNSLARREQGRGDDSMVDFSFEDGNKTWLAELLVVFRADYKCSSSLADGTW